VNDETPKTDALKQRIDALLKETWQAGFDAESVTDADYTSERALADDAIDETCGGLELAVAAQRQAYKYALKRVDALQAERDGWKIACEAAQKVARDNEAELAEARRQIDALVNLYSDCGDCETCPSENSPACNHDITKCAIAIRQWSLAEARKGKI
jgi:hypothetical protein